MSSTTSNPVSPSNLAVGAAVSLFEVNTLGQPLEVIKTRMASHRDENLRTALRKTYARGGPKAFYAGLWPWAWIESSTAGGILLFTSSLIEDFAVQHGVARGTAGLLGGMGGGAAQAYLAMGICTCMKTAEITRQRAIPTAIASAVAGQPPAPGPTVVPSTMQVFGEMWRKGGIRAVNKGVNAVALRQVTNWGSRIGIARAAEEVIKDTKGLARDRPLGMADKVLASSVGGALGCWNHPIEVIRVEMQSLKKSPSANRPAQLTMFNTLQFIYKENGIKGLFRGVTPRIGLSVYRTICLVSLGDYVKSLVRTYEATGRLSFSGSGH
ncbi:hypothetical protein JCM21900_006458 [Sporobolomyces salmonicolor]